MAAEGKVSYKDVKGPVLNCELKKFIDNAEKYKNVRSIKFHYNQTSTGSAVEVAQKTGTTITEIGKTEVTVLLDGDADNASTNGNIYTFVYKDADGAEHTAIGTGTATLNGTPVAFVPAVTDCYCAVSFTGPADANVNVLAQVNAGILLATISKGGATAATQLQLSGVGAVSGRYHTNHNNYDGAVQYMEYSTPWGEVKWAHCTTNTTDSTTEVIFYEATNGAGNGVTTATATTIKDFYRVRWLHTTVTPEATHTFLLTDAACANVDGSGTDVYGMIEEAYYISVHSRYHCPLQHNATLVNLQFYTDADATNYIIVAITYTPINIPTEVTMNIIVPYQTTTSDAFKLHLRPGTDISFTVIDAAGAKTIGVSYKIVEAEDKHASY